MPEHPTPHVADVLFPLAETGVLELAQAPGEVIDHGLERLLHIHQLLAYVFLFAICDASAPTNWAVVGEYFGRQTFSRLRGYIQFANFPGVLFAPVFVGWWYDHHHSYALPIWIYTGVSLVGALTFAVLDRPHSSAPTPEVLAAESPQASD